MARVAVLAGRTIADLARNVPVGALMTAVGFLVGFRCHNGLGPFILGLLLVLAFGFTMTWIFAVAGPGRSAPRRLSTAAAVSHIL